MANSDSTPTTLHDRVSKRMKQEAQFVELLKQLPRERWIEVLEWFKKQQKAQKTTKSKAVGSSVRANRQPRKLSSIT